MKFPLIAIIFIIVIYNVCPIHSEPSSEKYHPHKYDLVKLVQDVSTRISENRDLKNFANRNVFLLNELKTLFSQTLNPLLLNFLVDKGFDLECIIDVVYVLENLRAPGGWAVKMIDSYGKPESGILQGNFKWLGDFSECVNIYAPRKSENSSLGNFHGKYCSLQATAHLGNMSLPLSLGTCLPDSCNPPETNGTQKSFLEAAFPHLWNNSGSTFSNVSLTCQRTSRELTSAAIGMICLISLFVLLAVIGSSITAYESFIKRDTSKDHVCATGFEDKASLVNGDIDRHSLHDDDILILGSRKRNALPIWIERCKPFFNCFCVLTNGEKLLNTASTEGQLPCLHGIRFLSLSWVIVCHTYAFCFTNIRNMIELPTLLDNWPSQIIMNGFFSVDSFFLLSGFLLAYLFFEQSSKNNGKIPWVYFYVHRYIRLTPVYMIMLGFYTALSSYLTSGPLSVQYDTEPICKNNWWYNLLYINNFQHAKDQCFGWAWYLANDMQFFVVSPILLIPLWRWPIIGYAVMALFLLATFMSNFILTYQLDLVSGLASALTFTNTQDFMAKWQVYFDQLYIRPYTRMSPYLVGIALAYYLYKRKQNGHGKNNLVILGCGWIIASTITLACQFGLYHRNLSVLESSLYNAFSRTCFAGGLAWVMFVCLTGQGGFINSILSYKLFIPLSRLTYCAYLVHPIVMYAYFGSMTTLINFSHITLVLLFLGFLMVSYAMAFITSLLFESPIIRLEKYTRTTFSRS